MGWEGGGIKLKKKKSMKTLSYLHCERTSLLQVHNDPPRSGLLFIKLSAQKELNVGTINHTRAQFSCVDWSKNNNTLAKGLDLKLRS